MKKVILLSSVAFLFYGTTVFGQGGNIGNNSSSGGFLGFNGIGLSQPLQVRNDFNQPINFFAGSIQRMTILGADNLLGSPQFATERAGNVGIGTRHPLTLLHMGGEGASGAGWRDWMDIGTYYASREGFDNMYVGLRRIAADRSEAIINFGNNPSGNPSNGDLLRFVFTAAPGNGLASSGDGFELARMWVDGQDNGRMGIGDFFTAATQPENTLEIMASQGSPYWNQPGGTSGLRFTHLTSNSTTITNPGKGLLAVDEKGDVIYVDPSAGGGGSLDCRWEDINSVTITGEKDIRTGYNPEEDCYRGKVAIGEEAVKDSKLMVLNTSPRDKVKTGIAVYSFVSDFIEDVGIGISANSWGYPQNNLVNTYFGVMGHGGQGSATSGKFNVGVYSRGTANQDGYSFGTYATASGGLPNNNIAVYAEANVALYTVGAVVSTGPPINISDESIKTNVEDVLNATEILSSLQPRTYLFQNPENRELFLEEGPQYGFIAQEVLEAFPDIVENVHIPEKIDSTGYIEGTSVDLLGVKYTSLIPILVAGFQEQQQKIDTQESAITQLQDLLNQQQEQINQLQEWITNCCAQNESTSPKNNNKNLEKGENQGVILHQNVPNPFSHGTRIEFELPQSANVLVEISDARGVKVITLVRATLDEGPHSYWWDAQDAASGVYFYSLIVDGKLMSKKMIRL